MIASTKVILTPTEAKRLLSKAVLRRDEVKKALQDGILMVHPSSTAMFMIEELGYKMHEKGIWICGHVSPKGLCASRKTYEFRSSLDDPALGSALYPFSYVIKKGTLLPFEESTLTHVLDQFTVLCSATP